MKLSQKLLCTAAATLLHGTTSLMAADPSPSEIVNKAYLYIGSMDKYAFDAVVTNDDVQDGKNVIFTHRVSVKVDRPDKLRVDTKGDIKDRSSYINDGLFTMIDHGFGYYGQLKTDKGIDGTLDTIFEKYGIKAPLAQLIYSDMDKRVRFSKRKNFGTVTLGDTECDYLAFSDRAKEVHVWIAKGDKPLVKRYIIIDKMTKGHPRSVTTLKWKSGSGISDSDFVFKAPKDASKISIQSAN
ncbi:MAG: DUF2092 domain-containing protein [Campylobacterota bacterium]|nr:DUF2092 domain-containing protein [Campylobacterota bacterium]